MKLLIEEVYTIKYAIYRARCRRDVEAGTTIFLRDLVRTGRIVRFVVDVVGGRRGLLVRPERIAAALGIRL